MGIPQCVDGSSCYKQGGCVASVIYHKLSWKSKGTAPPNSYWSEVGSAIWGVGEGCRFWSRGPGNAASKRRRWRGKGYQPSESKLHRMAIEQWENSGGGINSCPYCFWFDLNAARMIHVWCMPRLVWLVATSDTKRYQVCVLSTEICEIAWADSEKAPPKNDHLTIAIWSEKILHGVWHLKLFLERTIHLGIVSSLLPHQ